MSDHSVEKIGGTSMAATRTVFDNVLIGGRKGTDLYRRMFVVSAYAGITDLLLDHKKTGEPGVFAHFTSDEADAPWPEALEAVREAMTTRNADMFTRSESLAEANAFVDERIDGMRICLEDLDRLRAYGQFLLTDALSTVREMLSGLGEAHSAHSTALRRGIERAAQGGHRGHGAAISDPQCRCAAHHRSEGFRRLRAHPAQSADPF